MYNNVWKAVQLNQHHQMHAAPAVQNQMQPWNTGAGHVNTNTCQTLCPTGLESTPPLPPPPSLPLSLLQTAHSTSHCFSSAHTRHRLRTANKAPRRAQSCTVLEGGASPSPPPWKTHLGIPLNRCSTPLFIRIARSNVLAAVMPAAGVDARGGHKRSKCKCIAKQPAPSPSPHTASPAPAKATPPPPFPQPSRYFPPPLSPPHLLPA